MDGSCDACEPDEAQPATQVCHTCSFAFCPVHAESHASSTHHPLAPYNHEETQANGLGSNRDSRGGGGDEDEAGAQRAAGMDANQAMALLGGAMADAHVGATPGESKEHRMARRWRLSRAMEPRVQRQDRRTRLPGRLGRGTL